MILIGLGSSLPFCGSQPQEVVPAAIRAIGAMATLEKVSRLYASPAWPDPADPAFVNAVIAVRSNLGPDRLLAGLHVIEAAFGRERSRRNAPRTIDLDLLAYGSLVQEGGAGKPTLPHPGLSSRDFVLAPLCDIDPDWLCPRLGKTARDLLAALPSRSATPIS
ncbi:MAG: 2-amino-4-hydroxy-6-hydroxymethyldihydropteridine diphosphokinase [Parvularculaceae bacterium]|nr:2-amino-4-hydroxy-6-hydroxymethyldihydropteridine diphosphokinase [Parvularculaceae bacterium]